MFYLPKDGHGLPHNPFNAIVTPRPIGWISTRGTDGSDNLAPYSFFNAIAYEPPQVMFSSTSSKPDRPRGKDSFANIEDTGVFCVNIVEYAAFSAMSQTSGPFDKTIDEFSKAGLAKQNCETIDCPRLAGAPAALECKLDQIVRLKGTDNVMVIGEVIGVHMRDDCLVDGKFDITRFQPLARLGYRDYTKVDQVFSLNRPEQD